MEHTNKSRVCAKCERPLCSKNTSGYCRAHFARALHDNPVLAERKATRHRATCSVSPNREIVCARLAHISRARLSWCPETYKSLYRQLTRNGGYRAAEARAIVQAQVAVDLSRRIIRPTLRRVA